MTAYHSWPVSVHLGLGLLVATLCAVLAGAYGHDCLPRQDSLLYIRRIDITWLIGLVRK